MDVINDIQIPFAVPSSGLPRTNGTMNRLSAEDVPFHNWYRFVLSFPSHLVRHYLSEFAVEPGDVVLDPFCGTGTTLVECKRLGIASVGFESHPMSHFAARVKTTWNVDPGQLIDTAHRVRDDVRKTLVAQGITTVDATRVSETGLQSLSDREEGLLISGSIDPRPLHRTLALRDRIRAEPAGTLRDALLLALASILPSRIGNLHFGPEVGVRGNKGDVDVCGEWISKVGEFAADLAIGRDHKAADALAFRTDSRLSSEFVEPESVAAVITSPPYPNEKDYTRTTRLESVVLGFITSKEELRAVKKGLVRSNTRNVYRADDDETHLPDGMGELDRVATEIERRRVELGKTSGFERMYARVAKHYFGGMARHLESLKPALRPGAKLAYVVGDQASYLRVMIRTGRLLSSVAEKLGYETERIDLFRTRRATATRAELREEVVVLRWPG